MHELYELKEKLCDELKEYGSKEMTAGSLDVVDKLAHAIKNLDKIIEKYDEGGSYEGSYYAGGMSRRGGSYEGGGSYARGRGGRSNARGSSYARRGGYSRDEEMVMELRELMEDAPDEKTRQEFQRFIQKIEMM